MIKTVVQGTLFKASNDKSLPMMIKLSRYLPDGDAFYLQDGQIPLSTELIRSFCYDVIRQVPSVSRCLLPIVRAISEKISNPSTQSFLLEFMSIALSGEENMIVDKGVYDDPFTIYSDEIHEQS